MNRVEFDNLSIIEQVDYINKHLELGSSLTKECDSIGIDRKTIRKRFSKYGFSFNKDSNKYMKILNDKSNIKVVPREYDTKVVEKHQAYKSNTIVRSEELKYLTSIKDDLLELIKNKDDILKIIKDYKSNTKIIEIPELNINDIPEEMRRNIHTRSLKIYDPVYELFDGLCNKYLSIKKQDLVSLALLEFYNKYKK